MRYTGSQMVICGNTYIEIENCKRIMEYNDIYLKIRTAAGLVAEIWGTELEISDYNTTGIAVRGIINSVEFYGREDA